jgi:cell division protein FtsW (lipid II flippase)
MLVMSGRPGMLRQQRMIGIACALAATCLGIAYLTAAGAPANRSVVNGVAFLLGVVALVGIGRAMPQISRYSGPVLLAMGLSLMVTVLLGADADGASRWIMIGPLSVQVSLVLVPFMAVTFARYPTLTGCLGIALAALALALQPDRAMAGVLAFSMAVLAITRPSSLSASALTVAITAFLVSMMRTDALPAVPYVDQILSTAFDVHILAGAAVWLGALLLLVPPILGWRGNDGLGHAHLVFGAIWLGCMAAAALGNYPTPVVGYGGSAILGYLLTFSFLPPSTGSANEHAVAVDEDGTATSAELHRSASLA